MSFTLIEQRQVRAARKQHKCIWCGEAIPEGSSYIKERSIFNDEPQSHHFHAECLGALQDAVSESGEAEFEPYVNERPEVKIGLRARVGEVAA